MNQLSNPFLKTIVLDFDGTIVDSYPILSDTYTSFQLPLADFQTFQNSSKFLKFFKGGSWIKSVYSFFFRGQVIRSFLGDAYAMKAQLFDGMADLLSFLSQQKGVRVLILSHNVSLHPSETIRRVLQNNKVKNYESIDIQTIPLYQRKSSFLEKFIQKNNIDLKSLLFVGDEASDFFSAFRLHIPGNKTVSYGYDSFQKLMKEKIPVDNIIRTPRECVETIRRFVSTR